jgi:hypothetical protein
MGTIIVLPEYPQINMTGLLRVGEPALGSLEFSVEESNNASLALFVAADDQFFYRYLRTPDSYLRTLLGRITILPHLSILGKAGKEFPCCILLRLFLAFTGSFCLLVFSYVNKDSKTTLGFPGELIPWREFPFFL